MRTFFSLAFFLFSFSLFAQTECPIDIVVDGEPTDSIVILTASQDVPGFSGSYTWTSENTGLTFSGQQLWVTEEGNYCVVFVGSNPLTADSCFSTSCVYVYVNDGGTDLCDFFSVTIDNTNGLVAIPTGGIAPYTYFWSDGSTAAALASTIPGPYEVYVYDGNGCLDADLGTLSGGSGVDCGIVPLYATITGTVDPVTGILTMVATSNVWGDLVYSWNTGDSSPVILGSPIVTMPYCVTISNTEGCSATTCFMADTTLDCTFSVIIEAELSGGIAYLTAEIVGGTAPYYMQWSDGGINIPIIMAPAAGVYTITVTDVNGCSAVAEFVYESEDLCLPMIVETGVPGEVTIFFDCTMPPTGWNALWFQDSMTSVPGQTYSGLELGDIICADVILPNGTTTTICYMYIGGGLQPEEDEISGFIYPPNFETVSGLVYLIEFMTDDLSFAIIDSMPFATTGGYPSIYSFPGLPEGSYSTWVDIDPSSVDAPFVAPTYSGWAPVHWEYSVGQAVPHVFGGTFDLTLASVIQLIPGSYSISGIFSGGGLKPEDIDASRSGLSQATILLYKDEVSLVGYQKADATGSFSFGNLPEGNYRVCSDLLNVANSCENIVLDVNNPGATTFLGTQVNSNDALIQTNMTLSPNPTTDLVRLSLGQAIATDALVQVTDALGRTIKNYSLSKGQTELEMDLSVQPTGLYFVRILGTTASAKVIKR
jgi:Secretion system C-terminal sorting domain